MTATPQIEDVGDHCTTSGAMVGNILDVRGNCITSGAMVANIIDLGPLSAARPFVDPGDDFFASR